MSTTTATTLSLDEQLLLELHEEARRTGRNLDDVAADLLRSSLRQRRGYREAITEGFEDHEHGRTIEHADVVAWLSSWGAEQEIDPPT